MNRKRIFIISFLFLSLKVFAEENFMDKFYAYDHCFDQIKIVHDKKNEWVCCGIKNGSLSIFSSFGELFFVENSNDFYARKICSSDFDGNNFFAVLNAQNNSLMIIENFNRFSSIDCVSEKNSWTTFHLEKDNYISDFDILCCGKNNFLLYYFNGKNNFVLFEKSEDNKYVIKRNINFDEDAFADDSRRIDFKYDFRKKNVYLIYESSSDEIIRFNVYKLNLLSEFSFEKIFGKEILSSDFDDVSFNFETENEIVKKIFLFCKNGYENKLIEFEILSENDYLLHEKYLSNEDEYKFCSLKKSVLLKDDVFSYEILIDSAVHINLDESALVFNPICFDWTPSFCGSRFFVMNSCERENINRIFVMKLFNKEEVYE